MCAVFLGCRIVHAEQAPSALVFQPANDFTKRSDKPEVPLVSRVLLLGIDQTLKCQYDICELPKTLLC